MDRLSNLIHEKHFEHYMEAYFFDVIKGGRFLSVTTINCTYKKKAKIINTGVVLDPVLLEVFKNKLREITITCQ